MTDILRKLHQIQKEKLEAHLFEAKIVEISICLNEEDDDDENDKQFDFVFCNMNYR